MDIWQADHSSLTFVFMDPSINFLLASFNLYYDYVVPFCCELNPSNRFVVLGICLHNPHTYRAILR